MLSGATRGKGGPALARHLLSQKFGQRVQLVAPRHLAAEDLPGQLRSLVVGAAHGRTDRPLYHLHVDPPPGWDDPDSIRAFVAHFESEFGLADQPRCGVLHVKNDRTHAHLAYSLVKPNGKVVDLRNDYRRREKCAVLTARELGLPPPPVPRPGAIYRALVRDGDTATAAWMRDHYDLEGSAQVASLSPARRHIEARTEVPADDLRAILAAAWPPSSPFGFRSELARAGLALAEGDKAVVVVDRTGTAHSLARELRAACKGAGLEPPRAAAVRAALTGLRLPTVPYIRKLQETV